MATCNLKFYRTNITPDKNRCYHHGNLSLLANMASATLIYTKENFQYQKISLRMSIKVSFSQNVQYYQNVNYLSLQDTSTNREYLFFIVKFEWLAQNTIKCDLYLDTIETFRQQIFDNITSSTFVMREHSDRARRVSGNINRIISKTDEGVGTITQELKQATKLTISDPSQNYKGYVAYVKGVEDDSPVNVLYFSDRDYSVINDDQPEDEYIMINHVNVIDNIAPHDKYTGFLITQEDSPNFQMTLHDGTIVKPFEKTKTIDNQTAVCRAIYFYNTWSGTWHMIHYAFLYYTGTSYPYTFAEYENDYDSIAQGDPIYIANIMYLRKIPEKITDLNCNYYALNHRFEPDVFFIYEVGTNFPNTKLATKSTFNFSDSFVMKIVELPFFPPIFKTPLRPLLEERLPDGFVFDFHYNCLRKMDLLSDPPVVSYNSIVVTTNASFYVYTNTSPRQIANESKLYNSSYYTCKFAYGSDTKDIKLENIKKTTISIDAFAPTNMSSTILFDFKLAISDYDGLEDYYSYMTTTRNNEMPVYNSSYLDYLRLQYTSDRANLKQSQDQKLASLAGSVTNSAVSTGASILGGAMVGASAGSGGGAIGAVIGGVAGLIASSISVGLSIYNTNNSIAQENRNFSTKINTLMAQNITLTGNADIALLDKMDKNCLIRYIYQAPDHIRQQLFDKFYYTGYAVGYRKMPDFTSRHNFNFVQCVPVFNNSEMFVSKEFLDDITERFASGVTFMHPVTIDGIIATYDENQTYENMEVSLL